jgi:hypothetical protein
VRTAPIRLVCCPPASHRSLTPCLLPSPRSSSCQLLQASVHRSAPCVFLPHMSALVSHPSTCVPSDMLWPAGIPRCTCAYPLSFAPLLLLGLLPVPAFHYSYPVPFCLLCLLDGVRMRALRSSRSSLGLMHSMAGIATPDSDSTCQLESEVGAAPLLLSNPAYIFLPGSEKPKPFIVKPPSTLIIWPVR